MVFKLPKPQDFPNHPPVVLGFNMLEECSKVDSQSCEEIQQPWFECANWSKVVLIAGCWQCIYFSNKGGFPWSVLPGKPCHLPFCHLLDPVGQLEVLIPHWDDEVRDLFRAVELVSLGSVTGGKRDLASVNIQPSFKVLYLVDHELPVGSVSFLALSDSNNKSLSNIVEGDPVMLVKGHQVFSRPWGKGMWRSCGGLYGG
jgi:hypothetical protein